MPGSDLIIEPKLIDLFEQIETASDNQTRSLAISKAKIFILNNMTDDKIKESFAKNSSNFESIFTLQIWSRKSKEDLPEFSELYEIIEKIFSSFKSLIELIDGFEKQISYLMNQVKDEKLKNMCLKFVNSLTISLGSNEFEEYSDPCAKLTELETSLKRILLEFVRQIPDLSVSYSQIVGKLLCNLTTKLNKIESILIEKHHNITAVFSSTIFDDNLNLMHEFKRIKNINSTNQIRVLEIFINLGAISNNHLINFCKKTFDLDENLTEVLNSSDILSKLTVINMLSNLAVKYHGYEFLHSHLRELLNLALVPDIELNPLESINKAAVIKLFSHISKEMPEKVHTDFAEYYDILFDYALCEDVMHFKPQINLAIQTFVYLFHSITIKKFISESYPKKFQNLLHRLVTILRTVIDEEIKENSLICIAEIISTDAILLYALNEDAIKRVDPPSSDSSISDKCHEFYKHVVSSKDCGHDLFFHICIELAKQPFISTRLAAQLFFKALTQSKWGLELMFKDTKYMKRTEFLREYLLNREIEIEKEGLESKYDLIKLICASFKVNNELFSLIGEYALEDLEQYIKLGPLYVPTVLKVAVENN